MFFKMKLNIFLLVAIFLLKTEAINDTQNKPLVSKKIEPRRSDYDFVKFEIDSNNHPSTVVTFQSTISNKGRKFEDDDNQPQIKTVQDSYQGFKYEDIGNNYPSNVDSFQSPALNQADKIDSDVHNPTSNMAILHKSVTSPDIKFEAPGTASPSNVESLGYKVENDISNQGYKTEESVALNANSAHLVQKPVFSNKNRFQQKEFVFSNHMRFSNQDQVKFQDDNTITVDTNFASNGMAGIKDQVTFQDYNKIEDTDIIFPNEQESNYGSNFLEIGLNQEPVAMSYDNHLPTQNLKKRKRNRRLKYRFIRYPVADNVATYSGYGTHPQGIPGQLQGHSDKKILIASPQDMSGQYSGHLNPLQSISPVSVASDALNTLTSALTNIALYDDYNCVSYLLCDAASGGSISTLGNLQTVQMLSKLQPVLHLLAAYSGLASSPMYLFGRAVFLGATSKGNSDVCHQAYPQCPTDPEKLVYYLNNHNGGLFRFFNAPTQSYPSSFPNYPQSPPNLEELSNLPPGLGSFHHNYGPSHPPYVPYSPQFGYGYQMGLGLQQGGPNPLPGLPSSSTPVPLYYSPTAPPLPPNPHYHTNHPHFYSQYSNPQYGPNPQYYASQYPHNPFYSQYVHPAAYSNAQYNFYPNQNGPHMSEKYGYQNPYINGYHPLLMKPY